MCDTASGSEKFTTGHVLVDVNPSGRGTLYSIGS
jgi:hypothetical protein